MLFILATLSLAVYGIVVGGWASNNKYSFLGGLRATASMISYEIPLGLCVLCVVLMFGTLSLNDIVEAQAHYWLGVIPAWNVFAQPLAFVLFLICIHAEANRAPFDLAEAEQELVGGYHTEYSSMRFALFFLSEYAGMITTSAVCVALFFGGWQPAVDRQADHRRWAGTSTRCTRPSRPTGWPTWSGSASSSPRRSAVIFVFMWVRWSLPRFRFDQLMMIAWRALIPMSLALLVLTAVVQYLAPTEYFLSGKAALLLLAANGSVVVVAMVAHPTAPRAAADEPSDGRRRQPVRPDAAPGRVELTRVGVPGAGRALPATTA